MVSHLIVYIWQTHRERVSRLRPCCKVGIVISVPMPCDVVGSRSIRRVTTHLSFFPLVYTDIVDEHLSGPFELGKVDCLEIVGHSKIENLTRERCTAGPLYQRTIAIGSSGIKRWLTPTRGLGPVAEACIVHDFTPSETQVMCPAPSSLGSLYISKPASE